VLNETSEKFLKAILERIPAERIVELHLFPAIRQGQIETGVAVIAAEPAPVPPPVAEPDSNPELPFVPPTTGRLEVHTARYRFTRKGPERGKWEVDVKAEADAPLITVEAVVRGVQERAAEAMEAHRLTGRELQTLLSEPAWLTSP
jgi:hypothetical protein